MDLQVELKRIQETLGITFVYVTHDQDEALTMSDRVAVMRGGRVEQCGEPRELYEEPGDRVRGQLPRRLEPDPGARSTGGGLAVGEFSLRADVERPDRATRWR